MGLDKEGRPWRRVTFDLPEPVAFALERALALAELAGEASNRIEAVEALAGAYEAEKTHAAAEHARKTPAERYQALCEAGFRCLVCGRSGNLECHHGTPRSQQGGDSADNLFVLCHACHERITSGDWVWSAVLPEIRRTKEERACEVRSAGFAMRKDQRWRLDAVVKSSSSP